MSEMMMILLTALIGYVFTRMQEHQREVRRRKASLYARFLQVNAEYEAVPAKRRDLDLEDTQIVDELCMYASPDVVRQIAVLHRIDVGNKKEYNQCYAELVCVMRKDVVGYLDLKPEDIIGAMELDVPSDNT